MVSVPSQGACSAPGTRFRLSCCLCKGSGFVGGSVFVVSVEAGCGVLDSRLRLVHPALQGGGQRRHMLEGLEVVFDIEYDLVGILIVAVGIVLPPTVLRPRLHLVRHHRLGRRAAAAAVALVERRAGAAEPTPALAPPPSRGQRALALLPDSTHRTPANLVQ